MPLDIVGVASGKADFSILVAALQRAELEVVLQEDGPFTVFAPTNAAFEKAGINIESLSTTPKAELADILLYHVLGGSKVGSFDLSSGVIQTNPLAATNLLVDVWERFWGQKIKLNGHIRVINADIQASNGIIHAIDNVLLPPSDIVTAVSGVEKFSTLVSLLVQADLVATLSNDGPFTVFAPTNEAFAKLDNLEDLTTNDLKNILLYHVVSDNLPYAALASEDDTQELETLFKPETINVIVSRWVWR